MGYGDFALPSGLHPGSQDTTGLRMSRSSSLEDCKSAELFYYPSIESDEVHIEKLHHDGDDYNDLCLYRLAGFSSGRSYVIP